MATQAFLELRKAVDSQTEDFALILGKSVILFLPPISQGNVNQAVQEKESRKEHANKTLCWEFEL